MNLDGVIFKNIFVWKPHLTSVTVGCPRFHFSWMTDIHMSHPVLNIRKFTGAKLAPKYKRTKIDYLKKLQKIL